MTAFDPRKVLALGDVAVAPSPATSGTSLEVLIAQGDLFPNPSVDGAFNVYVAPANAQPTKANTEVIRLTARSTSGGNYVYTIVRAQEGTTARSITVGDKIYQGISDKVLDDIETAINDLESTLNLATNTILGRKTAGSGDVEELTPTDVAEMLKMNTVINLVRDYGLVGDDSTDNTTALQTALDDAVTNGTPILYAPAGIYRIASGLTIDQSGCNGLKILGDISGQDGTVFKCTSTTGDIFTVSNSAQRVEFENIKFTYSSIPTAGYAIKFSDSSYRCWVSNCQFYYCYEGISVLSSTETKISNVEFRYMFGKYIVNFAGANGAGSYGFTIDKMLADNPYPQTYGAYKTWAISTAYSLNDIINVNGCTYQCSQAGTSAGAGSGPSGVPGTTPANAFTTEITDGTAKWKFVSQQIIWIRHDNYAYSLRLNNTYLLNGQVSVMMSDTANTGTSYPMWLYATQLESDHCTGNSILANYGEGIYITNSWIGSSLNANGIAFGVNFRGEASITNSRITYASQYGVLLNGGGHYVLTGNIIGDNSQASSGTYHGVVLGDGVDNVVIVGNKIGDVVGVSGNPQGYGVYLVSNNDNVRVVGNDLSGNVTGEILNGSTGTKLELQGINTHMYTMQLFAPNQATTTDGATIHWATPATTGTAAQMATTIPRSGKIKRVDVNWQAATAGSNENISIYIRKNDTTDTLVQTVGNTNAVKTFSNSSLDIDVTAGDTICMKSVYPTWGTNPANVRQWAIIYIETGI